MKIVATDVHTTSFDGICWDSIKKLGAFEQYDYTAESDRIERLKDADIAIVNKTRLDRTLLENLPNLKFIAVSATGTNNIDLEYAGEKQIPVANVPGYSTASVAQYVFACILDHYSALRAHTTPEARQQWCAHPHFSLCLRQTRELSALHLGILGLGTIGKQVQSIAEVFGMQVSIGNIPGRANTAGRPSLDELLPLVDVLTVHCPLSDLSFGLIGKEELSSMKRSAVLINTARGGIVDEHELARALEQGEISAAYTDVLTQEPPTKDHPLLHAPNSFVTPHMSWATTEVRQRLIHEVALNIKAFQQGQPRNKVTH